jgi:FdhD/NarQ family
LPSFTDGVELRTWLSSSSEAAYRRRRRYLAGPTGCGLCGIESIAETVRPTVPVRGTSPFDPRCIPHTVAALASAQRLNKETRATHAAGFYQPGIGLVEMREDVGRHNALDKLAGALSRRGVEISAGAVVLTSRVSVEMVEKTAAIGPPVLIAISAPTAPCRSCCRTVQRYFSLNAHSRCRCSATSSAATSPALFSQRLSLRACSRCSSLVSIVQSVVGMDQHLGVDAHQRRRFRIWGTRLERGSRLWRCSVSLRRSGTGYEDRADRPAG